MVDALRIPLLLDAHINSKRETRIFFNGPSGVDCRGHFLCCCCMRCVTVVHFTALSLSTTRNARAGPMSVSCRNTIGLNNRARACARSLTEDFVICGRGIYCICENRVRGLGAMNARMP